MTLVGCIGGGQLGRMLGLAGLPLGCTFRFLDPSPEACAGEVGQLLVGAYDDPELLARLADGADVVTFEFENVPVAAAAGVGAGPGRCDLRSTGGWVGWACGAGEEPGGAGGGCGGYPACGGG